MAFSYSITPPCPCPGPDPGPVTPGENVFEEEGRRRSSVGLVPFPFDFVYGKDREMGGSLVN